MADYILKDSDGNLFISITNEGENKLLECPQLTHCLAVVRIQNDYLLGWNKWRNRWEIFGGCIEKDEMPRECITRESYEELGIKGTEFEYLGVMEFLMKPDYFLPEERVASHHASQSRYFISPGCSDTAAHAVSYLTERSPVSRVC